MPITLPKDLPAAKTLSAENIFIMDHERAASQDIRPLRILVLNLMPTKIITETQIARLLSNTPLQLEMELASMSSRVPRHTPQEHMIAFYKTFPEFQDKFFDGLIITGAPVEHMPFEQVDYWQELCHIMEWSKTHVQSTLHICWGAQAGLYYHYGIPKYPLEEKMFGIFEHRVIQTNSVLFRGFDDAFWAPHSRHTTILQKDVLSESRLILLAESEEAGIYAISTDGGRQVFITGHPEYDTATLQREYQRDRDAGLPIRLPRHYYPQDDASKDPVCRWRSSANLLFANWLNYFVYQETPYQLSGRTKI